MAAVTPGMHYLVPAGVAGGTTAEVFEVFRIITQPAIPPTGSHPGSPAWTTCRLRGVNSGREIALGLPDLLNVGEPVTSRKDSGNGI